MISPQRSLDDSRSYSRYANVDVRVFAQGGQGVNQGVDAMLGNTVEKWGERCCLACNAGDVDDGFGGARGWLSDQGGTAGRRGGEEAGESDLGCSDWM